MNSSKPHQSISSYAHEWRGRTLSDGICIRCGATQYEGKCFPHFEKIDSGYKGARYDLKTGEPLSV